MPNDQQERDTAKRPLLERRTPFGVSFALLILFLFFFCVPFAFRSARLSLHTKENDIKDWLPSDFVETAELEWFAGHFAGESFVIATWPGCTAEDQRLKLLESKLRHESSAHDPASEIDDPKLAEDYRSAKAYGIRLGLLPASREFDNWGGENEKWFATGDGRWYYIKPNGRLFRWEERSNGPAGLVRGIRRAIGWHELGGTFVAAFGTEPKDDEAANPFYNDPSLLTAPMFRSVETGVSMVNELAKEGGLLWPVDFTDQALRPIVARRRAMDRLTGSLFAPAVPSEFQWTPEAFREVLPEDRAEQIPAEFDAIVTNALDEFVDANLEGDLDALRTAPTAVKTDAWYAVFDAAEVEPPPRQTALLLTLTDIAQDNLAYALGRGVLGGPRGRLLQLAADSGVMPAPPPSMAPPPFNRPQPDVAVGGMPPLRMGGPPVDNIAIDEEGTITLVRLVGYSILVGVVLSYLCFASVKITIMVFIVGGSAAMLSMAFVNWTGGGVDAILMSMPSLVYVLGLSGAIHVVNYYRDEVRQRGRRGAAGRALRHALFPCSLAALTTAIGLGSLYTSNLAPISNFGIYSAIGVIATLGILFSYLPAALQVFVSESRRPSEQAPRPSGPEPDSWLSERWAGVGRWISRHHVLVASVCLAALVAASFGLGKIKTSVQLLKLFDEDARIIRDYEWLEENFGKLVPMELVLRVPPKLQSETLTESLDADIPRDGDIQEASDDPVPLNILERVEAVSRIKHVVQETLGEPGLGIVGSTTAVDTFLKPLPDVTNSWNVVRSQYITELAAGREELLANDYVRMEQRGPFAGSELWRISLRVSALSDVDYGTFIQTLRTAVEPVIRAYDARDQIIESIAAGQASKPTVVILGAARPEPLEDTRLVRLPGSVPGDDADLSSGDRILTRPIFLSTLDELLRGERIRQAVWLDLDSQDKPIEIGGELWDKVVSRADVVVWADRRPLPQDELQNAKAVVDARQIFQTQIEHELVGDKIPQATGAEGMQVVYTGVVPVVYKAQRTLLGSLVESIALAFVLIGVVMIVLLNPSKSPLRFWLPRNLPFGTLAGAVSMIPNMFPVLLVFGLMGHFGRLVDIGTMMTASVAMGVAVDDTIHFLTWFRTYLDRGYDRIKAIEMTYRRVGPAMTQTTIVGGLGLFVFALSTFTPTQRFGSLMLILLGAALIGDLILLPALLAGPLGKFFKPRENATLRSDADEDARRPDEDDRGEAGIEKEGLPHLKLHSPSRRTDQPHRMKGR